MKESARRLPTILESIIALSLVIGVVIAGVRLGIGGPGVASAVNSLFIGMIVASAIALYFGNPWEDIQKEMIRIASDSLIAIIILLIVGCMIGVWMVSGTVPALIYYGLMLITPDIMLPLTFVLCAISSLMTGTSFGTMSTMGLALVGVAMGLGMPTHVVAGAAVAGAYFGDKMSPLSDTTLMASGLTKTPLYEHIFSMFYTTIPATVLCIVVYWFLGRQYAGGELDDSNIVVITDTLKNMYSITPWVLIPALMVLLVSAFKIPAVPGLAATWMVSVLIAVYYQGATFIHTMTVSFNGFSPSTGVRIVDTLLNRGGMVMMRNTVFLIILACMMGGALSQSGVFRVFVQGMFKIIKRPQELVVGTMVYCYALLLMSGNQVLPIVLGGPTFGDAYKEKDLNSKVLSRTLEDTTTIAAPLVPWSTASVFACSVMGVTTAYIPYAFFGFFVPIFTLICCYTGFGMFRADGTPMWGKKSRTAE
jgi:NhaC family Na+:H+ antiporter